MSQRITIQDIAKQAGVSKATVSRVLNHKPDVDSATRERILAIIDELGFVPNLVASRLAGGRNRLLGVLIPALTWPLIPELMRGIAEVIDHTFYELVLYSIHDRNHEKNRGDIIDHILSSRLVAGLLAIYPGQSVPYLRRLHKQGIPVVMLDDQIIPPDDMPWVVADQQSGSYNATRYLIEHGHRRIAHIQGPLKYQVSLDRYHGYCQALIEAGLELDPELIVQGDFQPESGKECAKRLLARPEQRPSAIVVGNDLMAFGVFSAAELYSLDIPRDLSVIGFDDIVAAAHIKPALTTVRQPLYEMGQRAMELLLQCVDVFQSAPYARTPGLVAQDSHPVMLNTVSMHISLKTCLVVRESCGDFSE